MLVSQILKSKSDYAVVTVLPGASVAEVARLLASRKIGTVVVSEDGKHPLGIVSERDIVAEVARNGSACVIAPVDAIMTRNVTGCTLTDHADIILQKMTDGRFRHMPVMDSGVMVGLISIGDVVKARLSELAMEKDALEGMIKGF